MRDRVQNGVFYLRAYTFGSKVDSQTTFFDSFFASFNTKNNQCSLIALGFLVNFSLFANLNPLNVNKLLKNCSSSLQDSLVLKFTAFNWSFIG